MEEKKEKAESVKLSVGTSWSSCPFCFDLFKDPVLFPCGHSVCRVCVKSMLAYKSLSKNQSTNNTSSIVSANTKEISCPSCSQSALISSEDSLMINFSLREAVADLASSSSSSDNRDTPCDNECDNKAEVECDNCEMAFCQSCFESVHKAAKMKQHKVKRIRESRPKTAEAGAIVCEEHKRHVEMYCQKCNKLVCAMCIMKGEHDGHARITMEQYRVEQVKKVEDLVGEIRREAVKIDQMVKEQEEEVARSSKTVSESRKAVNEAFDEVLQNVREQIEEHRQELLAQIEALHEDWKNNTRQRCANLRVVQEQVVMDLRKHENMNSVVMEIDQVTHKLEARLNMVQEVTLTDDKEEFNNMFRVRKSRRMVRYYGENYVRVIVAGSDEVLLGHLDTIGRMGNDKGEFQHPEGVAVDNDGGIFVADFGNSRVQKFNEKGEYVTEFATSVPRGIAVDKDGNMYVGVGDKGVEVMNKNGQIIKQVQHQGKGEPIGSCWGVSLDAEGNMLVVDSIQGTVHIYDKKGEWKRRIPSKGDGANQLQDPRYVALDEGGDLYVTDIKLNAIQVYDYKTGEYKRRLGGQLNGPMGIAVTKEGLVVVAEYNSGSITILRSTDGEYVDKLRVEEGVSGLALTATGLVVVNDEESLIEILEW